MMVVVGDVRPLENLSSLEKNRKEERYEGERSRR